MNLVTTLIALALFSPFLAKAEENQATIFAIVSKNENFSSFALALEAAGLDKKLSGKGPFTLFVPSNTAFKNLPDGTLDAWLKPENKAKLTEMLNYYFVPGKVLTKDADGGGLVEIRRDKVTITVEDGEITIGKAKVIKADIIGSNGVVHFIDTVIIP